MIKYFIIVINFLFFLVIFYNYPEQIQSYFDEYVSRWDFGTPFLRKYFLTFDYDNKYIGFYNNNITMQNINSNPNDINKNNNSKNKYFVIIILVILIIIIIFICICICIFIVRKHYVKKRKICANELIDDNFYYLDINEKSSNYYNIEMGEKKYSLNE